MQGWAGTVKFPVMGFTRCCDFCGAEYVAKRTTSRFCCESHRVRNAQSTPQQRELRAAELSREREGMAIAPPAADQPCSLVSTFTAELAEAGLEGSVLGQLALALAARIDSDRTSDASRAPLSKEFSRLRAELLRDVPVAGDFVDELKARVAKTLAGSRELFDRQLVSIQLEDERIHDGQELSRA